jgi:hypothetical protein
VSAFWRARPLFSAPFTLCYGGLSLFHYQGVSLGAPGACGAARDRCLMNKIDLGIGAGMAALIRHSRKKKR